MKVFQSILDFSSQNKTVITIGTFDGVHIGHQKVLTQLMRESQKHNAESLVITFDIHPRAVLEKESDVKLLTTNKEKIDLIKKMGVDNLIIQKFDKEFSELSGEAFAKCILSEKLKAQKVIIGYDHRFGKDRVSDINDLIRFGAKFGFEVEQISAKEVDEIKVSSTQIRKAIFEGNISVANSCLGYNYFFSGIVVKGKQLGRTIGFPTANIQVDSNQKILPRYGVYVVMGRWDGKAQKGMMNIGVKPTVGGANLSIEVHFFYLDEDLYGKEIEINVLEFVREEKKFDSLNELKLQIERDKDFSLNYFETIG